MRELLQTSDQSYALSVRIALDAAHIPVVRGLSDAGVVGYGDSAARFILSNDADYDRAMRAVSELQCTSPEVESSNWFMRIAVSTLCFLLARGLWFCVATVAHQAWNAWRS